MSVHRKIPPPAKPPSGYSSWLDFIVSSEYAGTTDPARYAAKELTGLEARLAAAEAVCERVDSLLTPSFDATMDDLLSKWMKLKDKQ